MAKTMDAVKRDLLEQWKKVCNGLVLHLCLMWELDFDTYGYWIGDNIGGTFAYGDTGLYIDMDNIKYCVENDVSFSEYMEWLDYCMWAADFRQNTPNLRSWHNGCPRVDVVTQERMTSMRYELEKLIQETKEKF